MSYVLATDEQYFLLTKKHTAGHVTEISKRDQRNYKY